MTRAAINKVMTHTAQKYNATHFVNETAFALNETVDYLNLEEYNLFQFDAAAALRGNSNYNGTGFREIITEEWTDGYKQVRPIHIATTIMFLSGILHILMGIFRLDFLSSYFSEQIMSGFIVGGSIHVFFAQIGDTIGIELPKRAGMGYLYFVRFNLLGLKCVSKIGLVIYR
uniref:SLC26A/SulP transporter domain-containing protein n=1 Tax=Panagrolaimus davidi TaxID=227884 RepID=A0A914QQA6_9BILA